MKSRFSKVITSNVRNIAVVASLFITSGGAWMGCGGDNSSTFSGSGGDGGGGAGSAGNGGGSVCGTGATLCGESCTVTSLDPANCGACDKACAPGEVCSAGQCGLTCGGGTTLCGPKCADTMNDPANCGACGTACAPGEVCSQGQCSLSCVGGSTLCGTICADTMNDPGNCGACGTVCATGEVCSQGQCGATCLGSTLCGNLCVDTVNDPANCGACGTICASGEVCSMSQCAVTCLGGTTQCGNSCVNVNVDPANCGSCGKACAPTQLCSAGQCVLIGACNAPFTACGDACTNTLTDSNNCGMCGTKCGLGSSCVNGACTVCNSATTDCDSDGWLASEGDCCDKAGLCGAEPEKVNPGAIEVVGNGIDDNCNQKTDLFDLEDTVSCDDNLMSNSAVPTDYAKALGICRTTTENPAKAQKTWGLISAQLLRADGTALADLNSVSIRPSFGNINPAVLEGKSTVVMSSGIAADGTQTNPGPNGGAPMGGNVSGSHMPASNVTISGGGQYSVKDWFATPNLPLKPANGLPDSPGCNSSNTATAQDSVMLVLRLRAPTNARAFSFNSYFMSAEYPEFVCTSFNDQFIALVDTPSGVPSPTPNPVDKNLMTFTSGNQKWPIGINIAKGTDLFAVCETQAMNAGCWDTDVSATSCTLGADQLTGTGFEKTGGMGCTIGGGTFWLTTAGNVIPGQIVEIRIALWDVGDSAFDSLAVLDGFQWLSAATLPGTGG